MCTVCAAASKKKPINIYSELLLIVDPFGSDSLAPRRQSQSKKTFLFLFAELAPCCCFEVRSSISPHLLWAGQDTTDLRVEPGRSRRLALLRLDGDLHDLALLAQE